MNGFINEVCVKWQKEIDNKILGEIKQKAIENGIKTEYLLNEKAIINALKKQIPKKPIKVGEEYSAITGKWEADYECATCGNPYADDSFCSCCGQALDWSDTE